jgi:hypothetical protein
MEVSGDAVNGRARRSAIKQGDVLPTPTGNAQFIVGGVESRGVTLLFGPKRTPTFFPWNVLEGVVDYLTGQGWIPVGANRDTSGNPGTLDWYLKQHVVRQTANYVAVLLARSQVLELDSTRPARVRLAAHDA